MCVGTAESTRDTGQRFVSTAAPFVPHVLKKSVRENDGKTKTVMSTSRTKPKKPLLISVVAVADVPDKDGNVFPLATLQAIADKNPQKYWMSGSSLLTNQTVGGR